MLNPKEKTQFKKDLNAVKKRGQDLSKLKYIVMELANERPLDPKYKDHPLLGKYKGDRECHLESDWLLVYTVIGQDLILVRTGTHSDLFDE
jgi:mRNA interferase YafQ